MSNEKEFSLIRKLVQDQMLRVDATTFADYLLKNKLKLCPRLHGEEPEEPPSTVIKEGGTVLAIGFEGQRVPMQEEHDKQPFQCCQCGRPTVAAYYPPCAGCRSLRCYECANGQNSKAQCNNKSQVSTVAMEK